MPSPLLSPRFKAAYDMLRHSLITLALMAAAVPVSMAAVLAPGRADKKQKAAFKGRAFAHRGLYDEDQTVPENSLPAFEKACSAGYGIELDVQLSEDGKVVVFHDDDLKRACGIDRPVSGCTYFELHGMRLFGTDERIPLFADVLELVAGRVPLIVELKTGDRNAELCEKALDLLRGYDGAYCVESFDPRIVAWFRINAADVLRGQLSQPAQYFVESGQTPAAAEFLESLAFNVISRPQFIAYRIGYKPASVRICESLGAMRAAWTCRDGKWSDGSGRKPDMVIFEHCVMEDRAGKTDESEK